MSSARWTLVASILGSSLVFIDGTVVSIALPVIQREFHANATAALWVVESYTLVLGTLMLLCGALADRYGRRRIFIAGVAVFSLGSLLCAFSPSMSWLVAARILAALGGTMLAPASLAMLSACFTGKARGRAIGTWSAFTAIAMLFAPVLGGLLLDHVGWRWVFGVNIPIAAFVIVVAILRVTESRDESASGLPDILGSALVCAGLGSIVYALITASQFGFGSARILIGMIGGAAMLVFFWLWERRAHNPIVPQDIFASRSFAGINTLTFLLYGALGGLFYFLPFVLIQADGLSAFETGASMLPVVVLIVLLSRFAGGLVYTLGPRAVFTLGPGIAAIGFGLFALLSDTSYWSSIFPAALVVGVGMGLTVAPLTATLMESVAQHEVGVASGINNAISRIAGLISVALLGVLLAAVFNAQLTHRLAGASLSAATRTQIATQRARLADVTLRDPHALAIVHASYIDGFRTVAFCCALLALGGAITARLTLPAKV